MVEQECLISPQSEIPNGKKFQRGLLLIKKMMPEVQAIDDLLFLINPRWEIKRADYDRVLHGTRLHLRTFLRLTVDYSGDVGGGRQGVISHQVKHRGTINIVTVVEKTAAKIHAREVQEKDSLYQERRAELLRRDVPLDQFIRELEKLIPRSIDSISSSLWEKAVNRF